MFFKIDFDLVNWLSTAKYGIDGHMMIMTFNTKQKVFDS